MAEPTTIRTATPPTRRGAKTRERRLAIGVDVGGSGIKAALVDANTGLLLTDRIRVPTPDPSTPGAVGRTIGRLVKRTLDAAVAGKPAGSSDPPTSARPPILAAALAGVPVGIGIPSVVIDGVTRSAANIDAGWVAYDADAALTKALGRTVVMINDADAAGLAEMRFGAGVGRDGVVLVLTLGTGVGSGMFSDGKLVPNTELGHMEIRGRDAERRSASSAKVRRGLSWKAWAQDLDEHLLAIEKLFSPKLIIVGGGISKSAERFIGRLTVQVPVVAARLRNDAGIVGAAMAAVERGGRAGS
ncbi:MAG: ROK family protein [Chloroflexota bacterium]